MTLITLDGLAPVTDTRAKTGGGRPFPCTAASWTKHTATVTSCTIKSFDSGNDSISIRVVNGDHGAELLVSLDPSGSPDPAKALATRNLAISILGGITNGKLDSTKIEKASGQQVEFIAKHKGFTNKDGKTYHKVSYILTGEVSTVYPVTNDHIMPALPGQAVGAPQSIDDIPF